VAARVVLRRRFIYIFAAEEFDVAQEENLTEETCPHYDFPLAEPTYRNKIARDLSPFAAAIESLPIERADELDAWLATATIPDIQLFFDKGLLSSEELVVYYFDRVRRYDLDGLNSFMALNPNALSIARALDEERARGVARGLMHGIPVLVKDNIATGDGLPTTAGVYALRNWIPDRDSFLVRQLRRAGAIIAGKANMSEFANYTDPCTPNGFSTLGGQTQNPHGPFDPLGSSSGSAVAVAANLVTVAIGSETQGSIIMPAWVNGIVGLKTSRGLVSRDYIVPLMEAQDVPGPMGRSVIDVAITLTAMVGTDENDPTTADAAPLANADFTRYCTLSEARRVRVGVGVRPGAIGVDPIITALNAQGVETVSFDRGELENMGVTDIEAVLPFAFRDDFDRFMAMLGDKAPVKSLAEVVAINLEDPANRAPYGQRHVQNAVDTAMTAEEFDALVTEQRANTRNDIRALLAKYGVQVLVITPDMQQYAAAGFPALAIPNGAEENGHPRSIVLMGDYLSEPQLLAVGYALEQSENRCVAPDLERYHRR
jgi:amidase